MNKMREKWSNGDYLHLKMHILLMDVYDVLVFDGLSGWGGFEVTKCHQILNENGPNESYFLKHLPSSSSSLVYNSNF